MLRRLFFGPARSVAEGHDILRGAPGLVILLIGGVLMMVITGALHLHGAILLGARVLLALPLIALYLGLTGEVGRIRYAVRQMRSVLASPRPWGDGRTWQWRLFVTLACVILRVPRRPWTRGLSDTDKLM